MKYCLPISLLFLSACSNNESSSRMIYSTKLHEACYRGDFYEAEKALAEKPDINAKDDFKNSPLEWAVREDNYYIAELLLKHGADVNVKDYWCGEVSNRTPLCTAVEKNYYRIAELLLQHGANTEVHDGYDRTPLGHAVWNKNYEMAKLLLEYGADPNKSLTTDTVYVRSILAEAIFQENQKMIDLLKKYGADINRPYEYGWNDAHNLQDMSLKDLKNLLKNRFNPSIKDCDGKNAFFYLPSMGSRYLKDIDKFIKLLKKHGMNIDDFSEVKVDYKQKQPDYINPLILAVIVEDHYLAEALLRNGANPELGAWQMRSVTPLHIAAMAGNLDMVKVLLKYGAKVEGTHYWGITPLSSAADLGKDFPAEYDGYRKYRWNGPTGTTLEEYTEIVKLLIEKGANVNHVEKYNETPLHHAVRGGYEAIVRLLLEHGAKIDAVNYDKETPLDIAKKLKLDNIQKILEEFQKL